MLVKLNRNIKESENYTDLIGSEIYEVIGVVTDNFRIINDQGRPYLYPADVFIIVDATEPSDWIVKHGEEGDKYAYPEALSEPGFFEDYFDDKPDAQKVFSKYLIEHNA